MKEQMSLEIKNNTQEGDSIHNLIIENIEQELAKAPKGKEKKKYLLEVLTEDYGKDLAEKILASLPEDFFIEKQTEKEIKQPVKPIEKKVPEEEVDKILKEEYSATPKEIKKIKKSSKWKKFLVFASIVGGIAALIYAPDKSDKDTESKDKTENERRLPDAKKDEAEKTAEFNKRFNKEIYNSLSKQAQEVYKFFAEENPTPGKSYPILEKKEGFLYIFSPENKLIAKIPAGFGKDMGDEQNTSKENGEGKSTTPSGVYIISDITDPKDIENYGELQFSLFGVSTIGDKVFLGIHQTYKGRGEFESRTKKLSSPTPKDNNFSDGCINIKPEEFAEYIKKNFRGDNTELLFVTQDKEGEEKGGTFDIKKLMKEIIPLMASMYENEEKSYQELIPQLKDTVNKLTQDSINLQKNHLASSEEYQKNKKDKNKQKQIEKIKEEIKNKKDQLIEKRKLLNWLYKKQEELKFKMKNLAELKKKFS